MCVYKIVMCIPNQSAVQNHNGAYSTGGKPDILGGLYEICIKNTR
jgi:hypothetical protein